MAQIAYDAMHRPVAAHRLKRITDSRGNKTLSYDWSPGGLLNSTQDSEGNRTDYLYDPVGRLTGIWAANDDYIAYVFDAGGRPLEKWYPNGINSQYEWNPDGTLAKLKNRVNYDDYAVVSRHEYTYTALGQRASHLEKVGHLAQPAQNDAYAYDAWDNRISQSQNGQTRHAVLDSAQQLLELRQDSPTGPLTVAFVYDANGNLTKKCEGGTVTRTPTDCTGTSVTQLTWSPLDELLQVSKTGQPTETYQYDHAGRRIAKTVNGQTTSYLYDGQDIHAEYGTSWTNAQALYTHGPETDDPLIREAANQARYYHRDGLGSVVATTDGSGGIVGLKQYDAWGNVTNQSGNIEQYGYTGREPDGTGFIYYRNRYYDPSIGRFVSRDPAGMPDGVNRYAYVRNNPVNLVDPLGLSAIAMDPAVQQQAQINRGYTGGSGNASTAGQQNLRAMTTMVDVEPVEDGYGVITGPVMVAAGGSTRTALPPLPVRAVETLRIEQLTRKIQEQDPNFKYSTIGTSGGSREGEVKYLEGVLRSFEQYPNKIGRTECHHCTPQYLGGPRNGETVPIPAPYQVITNEFRNSWGYGQGKPSSEELQRIMNDVYQQFPLPPR